MALTFPSNPNVGDTYLSYIWDGTKWGVQAGVGGVAGVSSFNTRVGAVVLSLGDVTSATGSGSTAQASLGLATVAGTGAYADLSGRPAIPAASSTTPAMDGTVAIGTGTTWARADHVHPTDTTRAAVSAIPAASSTTPAMDGAAAVGTGTTFARNDHAHPTDTSRAPLASPTFTGTVTAPNLTINNGGALSLLDASGTTPKLTVQADNNMVLFGTDAAGAARVVLAVGMRSAAAPLTFYTNITTASGPLTVSNGRLLSLAGGAAGCVAVSDGTSYNGMFVNGTGLAWGPTDTGAGPAAIWASLTASAMTVPGITSNGAQVLPLPAAKVGTSYTVAAIDCSLVLTPTGTFTLTLPAASSSSGRVIRLKLTAAFAVNSASSNIVQLVGGTATAAIMPATAGKWALLQSDGANWQIMQAN